ncbi:pikachurin isoform X2 [Vespula pensylvanica]|uniref:pikachurin isoform X2 n=1 Tax=Vespula pensylvanica TaxID=30213 RepID=UPI001CBA0EF6|nr:pikachurin isoform X2 [Vespula pensylvanica]
MARIRSRQTIMILGYLAIGIVLAQNPVDEKTTFEAAFQELNATSPSTSEFGELVDDMERDELNLETDEDEDAVEDILYMRGASFTIHLDQPNENSTTNGTKVNGQFNGTSNTPDFGLPTVSLQVPSTTRKSSTRSWSTSELGSSTIASTEATCTLDCGPGNCFVEPSLDEDIRVVLVAERNGSNEDGSMTMDLEGNSVALRQQKEGNSFRQRCQCPLGRGGDRCQLEVEVRSPRFTGSGWLAFPALRAAYKHVQLELEFRPEAWDGVLLLAGERDDLQGDFMALILHHGFIEFRFDCGSGAGTVRSTQTVKLNEWNTLSVYRHRWDAWIQLNQEKRVQGRSEGLFSRITFREPLFVGGPGNTSGLERLPVRTGFKGCIRHLEANEHRYRFPLAPQGDAANGFDVEECTADRCSKVPCAHGGKCLTTGGDTAVCLCPLGYTGDLCETRVDLQVPSFNGSSYLRYPGLGDTSLSWLELSVTLKPTAPDGVIIYNGHHSDASGDFIALYLSSGYVHFTFDLGTGAATLRSDSPVHLGEWLEIKVSRTGRLASLKVEDDPLREILAPGAYTQLFLPLNLYLGGAPSPDLYSLKLKTTSSFVGCIQSVILNRREIGILAEALGGMNVGNCGHACEARPCGDAECRPLRDRFTCRCHAGVPHPCPALDDYTLLTSVRGNNVNVPPPTIFKNSVPSFTGSESYLHYNDADTMKRIISYRVDINMRFRASSSSGLLLWSGRHSEPQEQKDKNDDFLALGLNQGYLTLAYNLGSGEAILRYNLTRLDDDLWHRVRAVRNEQWASLVVDSGTGVSASSPGQLRQLNTDTGLYVGGAPDIVKTTGGRYTKGIVGCISDLILDSDLSVPLSSPGQATNTHSCIP